MSRDKELNEWARRLEAGERSDPELELAAQLRQSQPPTYPAPSAFKSQLRGRLVESYQQSGWTFGRLASSVAAVAVLVAAVIFFRLMISGASQPGMVDAPIAAGATATPLPTFVSSEAGSESEGVMLLTPTAYVTPDAGDPSPTPPPIPLLGYSLSSSLAQRGGKVVVSLTWEEAAQAAYPATILASVYMQAADDTLVAQYDIPWSGGEPTIIHTLTIPLEAAPGDYSLTVVLNDMANGGRLFMQSAVDTSTELLLGKVTIVPDRVWINSVSPEAGTTIDGHTAFDVEIGYELVSAPTATLKLHLAHPEWRTAVTSQLPIEGLSEWLPITAGEGMLTVHYEVEDSNYLATLLGDRVTLYAQLATPPEDGRLNILLEETFTDYEWPVR